MIVLLVSWLVEPRLSGYLFYSVRKRNCLKKKTHYIGDEYIWPCRYHPGGERIKLGCFDILATVVRICLVVFNEKLDSMVLVIWEYSSE